MKSLKSFIIESAKTKFFETTVGKFFAWYVDFSEDWNDIVVDAEYRNRDNKDKTYIDEDYIDMEYVFNELGIDTSILNNVKDVQILVR